MKTGMSLSNAPSYTAVLASLRRLFAGSSDPDRRSVEELYAAWGGRDSYTPEQNKIWLRNKLTSIKNYGLAVPIRSAVDRQTVEYIQLTAKGKRALSAPANQPTPQESSPVAPPQPHTSTPSLDSVARDIVLLRKQNPHLHIVFSIEVREEVEPAI